jgi:hypothetical protein
MKLAEAIAKDMPFTLRLPGEKPDIDVKVPLDEFDFGTPYPLAWLWELRTGGIAFIFPGYGMSPGAEAHVPERGTEDEALRYFYFWHHLLPDDAVLSGTRNPRSQP